jgi:hypothetical protein
MEINVHGPQLKINVLIDAHFWISKTIVVKFLIVNVYWIVAYQNASQKNLAITFQQKKAVILIILTLQLMMYAYGM